MILMAFNTLRPNVTINLRRFFFTIWDANHLTKDLNFQRSAFKIFITRDFANTYISVFHSYIACRCAYIVVLISMQMEIQQPFISFFVSKFFIIIIIIFFFFM